MNLSKNRSQLLSSRISAVAIVLGALFFAPQSLAIPVYRSIDSTLSSGDYSIKELKKNQNRIISKSWLFVQSGRQRGWIERKNIFHLWDFVFKATCMEETPARKTPRWNSAIESSLKKGTQLKVLATQDHWAHVVQPKTGKTWWVNSSSLTPAENDFGYAFTNRLTPLFLGYESEREKFRLKKSTRIRIQSVIGQRFKTIYTDEKGKSHTGYVDINSVISTFNFATHVTSGENVWHRVLDRTLPELKLEGGQFLPIEKVTATRLTPSLVWARPEVGKLYRKANNLSALPIQVQSYQRMVIRKQKTLRWAASNLKKQTLWWLYEKPEKKQSESITTKELFARKVFSMESSPIKSNLMFASAKGVFRSIDGKNWKKIDQFADKDYPIAIAPAGTVLIGPYRSDDHGKTFQQYIRWHKIAKIISQQTTSETSFMEIRKLRFHDRLGHSYSLTIDNGEKLISVRTANSGKTWFLE